MEWYIHKVDDGAKLVGATILAVTDEKITLAKDGHEFILEIETSGIDDWRFTIKQVS